MGPACVLISQVHCNLVAQTAAAWVCVLQVQRQPGHVDAWRLLGTVHAENDDDTQAISAMGQALKADPTNSEVCSPLLHWAAALASCPILVEHIGTPVPPCVVHTTLTAASYTVVWHTVSCWPYKPDAQLSGNLAAGILHIALLWRYDMVCIPVHCTLLIELNCASLLAHSALLCPVVFSEPSKTLHAFSCHVVAACPS